MAKRGPSWGQIVKEMAIAGLWWEGVIHGAAWLYHLTH